MAANRRTKKTSAPAKAPKSGPAVPSKRRDKGVLARLMYGLAVVGVWGAFAGVVGLAYLAHDLPDLGNLAPPGTGERAILIKAADGSTLVRSGPIYGDWIDFEAMPDTLIRAFLAVEDRSFFEHGGVDGKGLARAAFTNIREGRVLSGGSTITQQLAKNLVLTSDRTIRRKAQELLLAFWLEQKFRKDQILTLYLNRVYFGGGAYGIDAAARKYFGHSARRLTIGEAALLAGLVKAPSRLAPHINPEGAWERARVVLSAMVDGGVLSLKAAAAISDKPPAIIPDRAGVHVRYFTDWIETESMRLLGKRAMGQSMIIYTTLDPDTQLKAAHALESSLADEGKTHNANQGALVATDHDGAVRAMVGGRHYGSSQFNRAVQAQRQPGSAFKLFSYLAAMEMGVRPGDVYRDEPIRVGTWSPKNYTGRFDGEMTVREAFARSINTIAVKVAEETGRKRVAAMAKRLGISTPVEPLASLPLGTEEVRLIDLTSAYATVANGGHAADPYGIVEITTLSGEVLYRLPPRRPITVLARPLARDMAEMLTAVIGWGSGKQAKIGRPAAGKSGTSQDSRDAVFVGFTSDLTAAVWVGNDDSTAMKGVTGGSLPARIWGRFMTAAHQGQPPRPLLIDAELFEAGARAQDRRGRATAGTLP